MKQLSYVQQRELALKEAYNREMAWLSLETMWETISYVMAKELQIQAIKRNIATLRAKFVRRGRPVGWRKNKEENEV